LLIALASCTRRDPLTVFVGTYSDGFHAVEFNQADGTWVEGIAKAEMPNPSYLAVQGNTVYAVSEMPDERASVWAWRWLGNGFKLLNTQPTGVIPSEAKESTPFRGEDPCYVSTNGTMLAVANYSGGTLATYRLRDDGGVAPLDSLLISGIGGPDLSRQESPHVHCAVFSPDGKYLFFSEFSADEIGRLDVVAGRVCGYCRAATLHPDSGPRHLLFDASGQHLYVIGELSGDITVFDYNDGSLREKQVIKADRMDARGAADIHFSPDGKFLYASLRLRGDGIAVFEVGPGGVLAYAGYTATGPHPRNFNITPNGKWVLVACRDNDSVEVYARDRATGMLTPTGRYETFERPVFVGW
jgi:6-phosphogluconolactonase (cycloisomerase 2 family)